MSRVALVGNFDIKAIDKYSRCKSSSSPPILFSWAWLD
ncbi:hypothetical protein SynA1524_01228 [Synechococcus sp. A15-24]|nr:hypothetical protein SynA1524_01228 [Synechococcus sp. A15-24]